MKSAVRPLLCVVLLCGFLGNPSFASNPADEKTLELVERRLRQDDGNPRLWAARGVALARLGRYAESLQSFERSLAISPKYLPALEGAAEAAYRQASPRAAAYVQRILTQDPANLTAHAMAGAIAFEVRDCRGAIDHFERSGEVARTSAEALAQWGECLLAAPDAPHAADKFRESLARQPDPRVRFRLAVALHLSGHQDAALEALRGARPDGATRNLAAAIYVAQNRFADAVAAYREAIALAPREQRNYIDLASLCLDHQSFDVAADVVNAGLAANPYSPALYTLRGAIAAQFSHMDEAAADFEKAGRLQPDQFYSDAGLSLLLEQQDQIDQAIAVIRPRLVKAPESAALHFILGDLILKSQNLTAAQRAEARAQLTEAIRLKPDLAKAHAVFGKLLLQEGQAAPAVEQLQLALRYNPADRIAMNQLVLAYRKLGRMEDARAAAAQLQRALADERQAEVRKNSVRFVRLAPEHP